MIEYNAHFQQPLQDISLTINKTRKLSVTRKSSILQSSYLSHFLSSSSVVLTVTLVEINGRSITSVEVDPVVTLAYSVSFCGGRDGTRCRAVSAAPFSPLVDGSSTHFLSFISLISRITLIFVLESTVVSISTFTGPGFWFGVGIRSTYKPITHNIRPPGQLEWFESTASLLSERLSG